MYGYWRKPEIAPTAFGQAMAQSELYDPTTAAVTRTFAEEATIGVGTLKADINALEMKMAEESGIKITEEEYKNSPELYSQGQPWYPEMTRESAKIGKTWQDAQDKRNQIISDSSTGQAILGFGAGFVAGVVEPKNAAIGLGVSFAAPVLGTAGYLGNRARMMYQLAKTSTRARVAIGAGEGVVAAALTEPSNRYSAKTLQQDYTMMDSAFNVLTSTAFGAAVPAAAGAVKKLNPLIQAKIDKFKGRTMDVVTAEVDLATQQLEMGQRVDVSAVEAAAVGRLADKSVTEQVEAVAGEYGQTSVLRAVGEADNYGQQYYVTDNAGNDVGAMLVREWPDAIQIKRAGAGGDEFKGKGFFSKAYEQLAKRAVSERKKLQSDADVSPDADKLYKSLEKKGYKLELNPTTKTLDDGTLQSADNKPVYTIDGAAKADEIRFSAEQADTSNATTIAKHNEQATDPRNDAVIDYDVVDALDERRAIMAAEADAEAEMYFQQAEAEIRQMLDEGTMNEDDLMEYRSVLEDMKESKKTTDALETLKLCLTGL